jgi:hypothetical protein
MGLGTQGVHSHHLHAGGQSAVNMQQQRYNYMYSDGSEEEVDDSEG